MYRAILWTSRFNFVCRVFGDLRAFSSSALVYVPGGDVALKESYFHGASEVPLLGKTLGVALQETVEKFLEKDAFIYGTEGSRHTYLQLLDEVDCLAAGLAATGIKKGDRVGMWGPNSREWILTQYACARVGAILVNVNPAYRVEETVYALRLVGMKAIVAPRAFKTQDYYSMLREICPELETTKPGNLRSERLPDLRTIVIAGNENLKGAFNFDDVMDMGHDTRHDIENLGRDLQFDEAINIQFTSGTTGQPKGAIRTHHSLLNNGYFGGQRLGCNEEVAYGMTESGPVAACANRGDTPEIASTTVGKPFDHVEVKIIDSRTKKILPVNESGEICVRSYSNMKGYWNDPEKTQETIIDGWMHSGDVGKMDEKGNISIVGRIKDIIVRGGVNIFPVEIEDFLYQHPKVETVQIVGVPDVRMGEEVCACIRLKRGESSTAEEIKAFCKRKISHFKIPRYVEFVESFPVTATLKVKKFALRNIMAKKLGLPGK